MTLKRRTFVNSATVAGASLALPKQPFAHGAEARLKHVLTAAVTHLYYLQRAELGARRRVRGMLRSGAGGVVRFRTVKPAPYAVPTDGPVGRLLKASGRHALRPAHLHFRIRAPGCQTLVTHVFFNGDPYLESDAVFGVRSSLIGALASIGRAAAFAFAREGATVVVSGRRETAAVRLEALHGSACVSPFGSTDQGLP